MPLPVPELDPPGQRSRSQGLRGMGNGFAGSGRPAANSIVVTFPVITAPALHIRATAGASRPSPHDRSRTRLWAVVGASAVARMSFTPKGMPWSGPRSMPAARSSSARRAEVKAVSSIRKR